MKSEAKIKACLSEMAAAVESGADCWVAARAVGAAHGVGIFVEKPALYPIGETPAERRIERVRYWVELWTLRAGKFCRQIAAEHI